jgi:hypothetical protein
MSPLFACVTRLGSEPIEMSKKLRCYFGFHRWHTVHVEGVNRYTQCSECGKVRLPEDPPPPAVGVGPSL